MAEAKASAPVPADNAGTREVKVEDPVLLPAEKYIYDLQKSTWKKIGTMIRVVSPNKSLGSGGMRICYEVEELEEDGLATTMVAKMFRRDIDNVVEVDYFNEGTAQCMCEEFANNFNRIHLTDVKKPNISFLQCYVVHIPMNNVPEEYRKRKHGFFSYRTQHSREIYMVMEPKLNGHFTKYNSNYGEIYRSEKKARLSAEEQTKREATFEAAEAFSHFTLVESGGSMLVCDLQGVHDFLTDPQIHTEDGKGLGMGNMGQEGIDKWVSKHACNRICKALGLQPFGPEGTSRLTDSRSHNRYVNLRAQLRSQNPVRPQDLIPLSKPLEEMTEAERMEYAIRLSQLTC